MRIEDGTHHGIRKCKLWCVLLWLGLMWAGSASARPAGEIHFDFETGQLQGWHVVRGGFGELVSGREQFHNEAQPYNKQGRYFLSTLEQADGSPSDRFMGVVESPVFVLAAPEMTFLIGGGLGEDTYFALCTLDGHEVLKAHGEDQERMRRVPWRAPELVGQPVFLRLCDASQGGWGHITIDDFQTRGEVDEAATARLHAARERETRLLDLRTRINPQAIGNAVAAVEALAGEYGERYPGGLDFLDRLNQCSVELSVLEEPGDEAAMGRLEALADQFEALRREALIANPLVGGRPLLFVIRRQYTPDHHNTATIFQTGECNTASFAGGGRLVVFDPAGDEAPRTLVDAPQGVARDPEVSFDGGRIVFSMRRDIQGDYKIYEVNADGSGLQQMTFGDGVTDIDPLYLPDGSIVFSSTRDPKYCMCNIHIMANLFRMDADGANIRQISRNTLFDGHGTLLPDGRILYDRWEYVDRNFGDAQGLWTVNPDGTNHALYWGNNTPSPGGVIDARPLPGVGERVIAVLGSCHDRPWGALGIIDRSRGLDGRAPIVRTWPPEAIDRACDEGTDLYDSFLSLPVKYEDPYPLDGRFFLCSRMTGEGEQMGIYLVDTFGNEILLYKEPGAGCFDPMPLGAHPMPPAIPARRDYRQGDGIFYVADVYEGTGMEKVERGSVKWLRVLEEPEKRFWTEPAWGGQGVQRPAMNWHDFNNKRILGTVPVEEDGSAAFKAPEGHFVFFQLLDKDGMMIQSMRSGTTIQSGEVSGCVGCHERRLDAPPVSQVQTLKALRRPPSEMNGWRGLDRPFNYRADVQPVFDRYCVTCHDYGKPAGEKLVLAGDRDLVFSASYNELWRKGLTGALGAGPAQIQPAFAWGSHASHLIEVLRQGHEGVMLDGESFDRLVTWIDLNAPYYPSYASAYPDNLAGRAPLDNTQLARLAELTGVDFGALNAFNTNKGPQVSFDRPELSRCLAGIKAEDPARREAALAIIRAGAAMLAVRPDAEMEGFIACPADQARQRKLDRLKQQERHSLDALDQGRKYHEAAPAAGDAAGAVPATVRDLLTRCDPGDRHDQTSALSGTRIDVIAPNLLSQKKDPAQ